MTEKRIKDINNCHKRREDRINLTIPKGDREMIQAHAAGHSESTNGFIRRAIRETIEWDRAIDQLKKEAEKKGVPLETLKEDKQYKFAITLVKARNPSLVQHIFIPPRSDLL